MEFINSRIHGRPDQHKYFMEMAHLAASRSNCITRKVGCIFVNEYNHVLATGYNGVPAGMIHCTMSTCPRIESVSGAKLEDCYAVHAEVNAVLQCKDVQSIKTAYITASPCLVCTCMLLNTSCERIIFDEEYPSPKAQFIWEGMDRTWSCINSPSFK